MADSREASLGLGGGSARPPSPIACAGRQIPGDAPAFESPVRMADSREASLMHGGRAGLPALPPRLSHHPGEACHHLRCRTPSWAPGPGRVRGYPSLAGARRPPAQRRFGGGASGPGPDARVALRSGRSPRSSGSWGWSRHVVYPGASRPAAAVRNPRASCGPVASPAGCLAPVRTPARLGAGGSPRRAHVGSPRGRPAWSFGPGGLRGTVPRLPRPTAGRGGAGLRPVIFRGSPGVDRGAPPGGCRSGSVRARSARVPRSCQATACLAAPCQ